MEKAAARGQITGELLRRVGLPRVGQAVEQAAGGASDALQRVLLTEVPGTSRFHLLNPETQRVLVGAATDNIATIPAAMGAAAALPVPGTAEVAGLGALKGDMLASKLLGLAPSPSSVEAEQLLKGKLRKLPEHLGRVVGRSAETMGEAAPGMAKASSVKVAKRKKEQRFEPKGLKRNVELFEHQRAAVDKVMNRGGSLLLSHGTGSGKTITAIASFEKMRDSGDASRALVVTPASLRANFLDNGVRKFTNARGAIFGNSQEVAKGVARAAEDPDDGARYHVVSYEMFRKDPEKYIKASGADTVIYDELHRIRNEEGATYKTLKDARPHHKNFIGLTGSIMNNTPGDMVPLVDAMTGGKHRLGTKNHFERRFVREDKKGQKTIARPRMVRALLNPFVDHFETKDMDDERMPDKVVEEVKVMMSPRQEELYRYVVDKLDPVTAIKLRFGASQLKSRDLNNIFAKIIQARQVSNSIHTIDNDMDITESAQKTPKVKVMLDDVEDHLAETEDGQVVIHSNLIKGGVDVVSAGLKDRGIPFGTFVGKGQPGVTEEKRQRSVRDFNKGKNKVLVISAAGGEGLDLKNATMFAALDGHFNPEKIQQAEARAVRAGGLAHREPEQRKVVIRRYVSVVPRSATQTAKDTLKLISPGGFLDRLTTAGAPIMYNPFKRETSPDEWMYDVAKRKDVLNESFRHQLKGKSKAASVESEFDYAVGELAEDSLLKLAVMQAAFDDEMEKISAAKVDKKKLRAAAKRIPFQEGRSLVKSDQPIMEAYWNEFGDKIEDMADPYVEAVGNEKKQAREQYFIDTLRQYYRAAARGTPAPKGMKTDKDRLVNTAKVLGIATPLVGLSGAPAFAPLGIGLAEDLLPRSRSVTQAAVGIGGAVAAGTGLAALMLTPEMLLGLRDPYFTTPKTHARKRARLGDEQLRAMLRGLSVTEEKVQKTEHYIPSH